MLCVKRHVFKKLNVTEEMKTGLIFRSKRRHLTAAWALRRSTGLALGTFLLREYATQKRRQAAGRYAKARMNKYLTN